MTDFWCPTLGDQPQSDDEVGVHDEMAPYREQVWETMRQTPQHTYVVLTKRPDRFRVDELMARGWDGANLCLGVSVASVDDMWRISALLYQVGQRGYRDGKPLFVPRLAISFEPLTSPVPLIGDRGWQYHGIDWIIIGAATGEVARLWPVYTDPKRLVPVVSDVYRAAVDQGIPVFVKENARKFLPIGCPMRQEWPQPKGLFD
jgi:protein gp37